VDQADLAAQALASARRERPGALAEQLEIALI